MIKSKSFGLISIVFASAIFLFISYEIKRSFPLPVLKISKQDSSININYQFLKFSNLGHKRLLSSLFWVATILESDHDHYQQKDSNSWMFLRFDTISKLDPLFYYNYYFGGIYLSIVKDDIIGATTIYKKGIETYPNSLPLLKNAAFHFRFEADDPKMALSIYNQISNIDPKNTHVKMQTALILSSENKKEDAILILEDLLQSEFALKNEFVKIKILEKIEKIKKGGQKNPPLLKN